MNELQLKLELVWQNNKALLSCPGTPYLWKAVVLETTSALALPAGVSSAMVVTFAMPHPDAPVLKKDADVFTNAAVFADAAALPDAELNMPLPSMSTAIRPLLTGARWQLFY